MLKCLRVEEFKSLKETDEKEKSMSQTSSSTLQCFTISPAAKQHWLPAFSIFLFALCYYGSYYRCSLYPASEGGLEGVIALRLLEGKTPFVETVLNYNLFWFYPIVGLFKIFGPSYTVLRIFFFCLATLTGLLSFYTVRLTTRRTGVAIIAGLLTLILPGQLFRNYMAFLVILNIALFLKAFLSLHQTHRNQLAWIGAAGFALSFTFLIRVDLGCFLSPIFFALALIFPWLNLDEKKQPPSFTRRFSLALAALLLGISSFFALHLPVYVYAQHRGFASHFTAQYQKWPHMMITQASRIVKSFHPLSPQAHTSSQPTLTIVQTSSQSAPIPSASSPLSSSNAKTTLLRRSIFSSDLREQLTALNLYLPIITSLLMLIMALGFLFQEKNETHPHQRAFQLLTSLGCTLALFPQYFFWRPDMVHLSEFMVPMTVTMIIAITFASEAYSSSKKFFRIFLILFFIISITTLVLYFINGCQSQSTGGIAISEGRAKEFFGENGVHVKLKPDEWEETSAIYQSILQHAKPGEYIVCFPYNPEINFMTNRPSYRYDLYCDDMTATSNFDKMTVAEIETFQPSVIVVTNWPINGTEHSRFSNWAKPTYDYIRSHYALDYSKGIVQVFIRK